jgi:lysylphosphatidylglycerol synthetase-like protein (DUF2156 family)
MPEPRPEGKSLPTLVAELWELVVAYLKQETVEPVKGLGRFLAFGVAGSLLLGIGLTLLAIAGLRALQTETTTHFTRNLSWVPYAITLVACFVVAGIAIAGKGRGQRKRRSP